MSFESKLDAWITGNYGEDHPDNQQTWREVEQNRIDRAHREARAYERWLASRRATSDEEVSNA